MKRLSGSTPLAVTWKPRPYTLRSPCLRRLSCTFLKKSKYASHVFGMSSILKPAFSTSGRQIWQGTTAALKGTP